VNPVVSAATRARRPTFLNFARIAFPPGALASIGHRISGLALACALPFAVLMLQRSLQSEAAFGSLMAIFQAPAGRIALVGLAWACAHHLFAGIRHLLMDVGIGSSLSAGRRSAYAVLGAALAVAAVSALLVA
jgi:succinate dehydrogenase / fumarate reductase, cytochrome b subunit